MKLCDICGTYNLKENNYCIHCGNRMITVHFCPHCNEINSDYATYCIKCGKQINPISIDDFDDLFTEYNQNLLLNATISNEEYNKLLQEVFLRAEYFDMRGDTIKDKILNFASIFTHCYPKSRGYERGFIFLGNSIHYDDRLDDSVQIATIIHELAHYLLFNIIELWLCKIFDVETSSTLQSFVWYFLTLPEFEIMNEYCAHTVEGRFIPYGYQNYGSFKILVENAKMDEESIYTMKKYGNTFANELVVYLEKYIDEDLREEIKVQYKIDLKDPNYDSIFIETDDCFPLSFKNSTILRVLQDVFIEASSFEVRQELEIIKEGIEID
ncbi:MAG: zinc-ribbon domain-containing protein [Methanobrevibacter sp.]|uniref:zinc ribbon domain-containing protein n=1 Tax=Methanobrevibacter sp. TaxID=66852 RepID=UPI0025DD2145|nr:zinc ribbon domain-containing protein [Methanobrevibacter sp.]MBE6507982.1 zinc-ribbon domain-containing protein [Methanobrevibacter sp.]